MNPSDMTNEQLRIAVAEALGRTNAQPGRNGYGSLTGNPTGVPPWYKGRSPGADCDPLPHFEEDLNACHGFEEALLFPPMEVPHAEHNAFWSRFDRYVEQLAKMCGSDEIFFATARQRCIALLKTLKKE